VRDWGGLKWVAANHQGSSTVQLDPNTLATTRRMFMPYGEPRGNQPPAWLGSKGYVDGTKDDTGLTHLGAREYDPTLGRFVSVDPIMDLTSPQQWHGYSYSSGSPVTFSDPTGLREKEPGGGGSVCYLACGGGGGTAITIVGSHTIAAPSAAVLKAALDASWQATVRRLEDAGCRQSDMSPGGVCNYSIAYFWHGDALCKDHPDWCKSTPNLDRPEHYSGGGGAWTMLLGVTVPPAIALGLTSVEGDEFFAANPDALAEFAHDTESTPWMDWEDPGNPWPTINKALEPESDVRIFFNLDGIRDPKEWARNPGGRLTAEELRAIRDAPKSVQQRVSWYQYGSKVNNPFAP
jgi:RHS repeat-associated protein